MADIIVDVDVETLRSARTLVESRSDQETVALALRTLTALHRQQPVSVDAIIDRGSDTGQAQAPTGPPPL